LSTFQEPWLSTQYHGYSQNSFILLSFNPFVTLKADCTVRCPSELCAELAHRSAHTHKHKVMCQYAQTSLSSPTTSPSLPPTKLSSPTIACARRNTNTSSLCYVHRPFAVSLACDVIRSCSLCYPFMLTFLTFTLAPLSLIASIHSVPQCSSHTYLPRLYKPSHRPRTDISTSTLSFTILPSRYLLYLRRPSACGEDIVYLSIGQF
jgi:hypothetical protein